MYRDKSNLKVEVAGLLWKALWKLPGTLLIQNSLYIILFFLIEGLRLPTTKT